MPEGFFRAGKVIFGRYACRMARKMNAVCLKKHPADRVRWLCIQVLNPQIVIQARRFRLINFYYKRKSAPCKALFHSRARLFRKKQYHEMLKGSHSVPPAAIPMQDSASHTPSPHGGQWRCPPTVEPPRSNAGGTRPVCSSLKLGLFVSPFFALKEENFCNIVGTLENRHPIGGSGFACSRIKCAVRRL